MAEKFFTVKLCVFFILIVSVRTTFAGFNCCGELSFPKPTGLLKKYKCEQDFSKDLVLKNGDVSLAGRLILPEGQDPFPSVVMVNASGPETRQSYMDSGEVEVFTNSGIAVFIYDKQGTGNSSGDWRAATLEELADDAIAAVETIKLEDAVHTDSVGVYGVSQGGTLAALAASRSDEIDFVINITATATPLANQEMWGVGNELDRRGYSEPAIDLTMKAYHLLYSTRPLILRGILHLNHLWFAAKDPYLDSAQYWSLINQSMFVAYGILDSVVPTEGSAEIALSILQIDHPYNRLFVYSDAGHGIRDQYGVWVEGHTDRIIAWIESISNNNIPAQQEDILSSGFNSGSNRWYGIGNQTTPVFLTAPVQLPLIILFFFVFILGIIISFLPLAG